MRPRAILFDLDDTILAYGPRALLVLELAEEIAPLTAPLSAQIVADFIEARFVDYWADEARGNEGRRRIHDTRRMLVRDAFAALRAEAPGLTPAAADGFASRFSEYREGRQTLFPNAETVIEGVRALGVKLALVTNGGPETQRPKIERFDLAHRFDHIQIEGEAGFGKPDARAYHHAMQALGVGPHETWMVGDNLEWEVAAPQRIGIFAIWHDHAGRGLPPGSPVIPDRIIRDLSEILDLLSASPA